MIENMNGKLEKVESLLGIPMFLNDPGNFGFSVDNDYYSFSGDMNYWLLVGWYDPEVNKGFASYRDRAGNEDTVSFHYMRNRSSLVLPNRIE